MNNTAFRLQQQLQTAGWEATQWQTFWFAQDDIRVRPDLTLNLGLRYELSEVPLGMLGATDPQSLSVLVPGPAKMDRNNWAPRVGLAWSPNSKNTFLGDGTTVVRGGFGVGYDVLFYRVIPFGDRHLRRTIAEFVEHYHRERNHQGLENELMDGAPAGGHVGGIRRRQRLGGLLNYYVRAA